MSTTRLIKRYQNNKLYDTEKHNYVTLTELGDLIKQKIDIKVVDVKTTFDITSHVLLKIIFNNESKKIKDLNFLNNILRTENGTFSDKIGAF